MWNKVSRRDKFICFFLLYVIVIYTFILAAFQENGSWGAIAKVLLLVFFILGFKNKYIIRNSINLLMLTFVLYTMISLGMSFCINTLSIQTVMKEIMYEIMPVLMFVLSLSIEIDKEKVIKTYLLSLLLLIIIGIPIFFNVSIPGLSQMYSQLKNNAIATGFGSYIGVIGLGYLCQLSFAILLFDLVKIKGKPILLVVFFAFSLFTLQRSSMLGIVFAILISFFNTNISRKQRRNYILLLASIVIAFLLIINGVGSHFFPYAMNEYIQSGFQDFKLSLVLGDRSDQMLIFVEGFVDILFGQGFGKYSPNNSNAIFNISDSSYYRIINELGIIGLTLFLAPFVVIFIKALRKKRFFLMYLVSFSLVSFYFNRTIWSIPSAYVFYLFMALETKTLLWDEWCEQ